MVDMLGFILFYFLMFPFTCMWMCVAICWLSAFISSYQGKDFNRHSWICSQSCNSYY